MKNIIFAHGAQYPELKAITSKKYYHGVLTVNLGIFDKGVFTTFATEKEGVIFSELLGSKETGDMPVKFSFENSEEKEFYGKDKGDNFTYQSAYLSVPLDEMSGNIEIMKEHVEDFGGVSYRFEDGSEIYAFISKGDKPEFTLYVLMYYPDEKYVLVGESSLKLKYSHD